MAAAASAHTFSNLYVFGDSLSDVGQLFNATGGLFPPSPFYNNGRFSNGPVWVEYLAPQLGLGVDLNNDFALGGATTGTNNALDGLIDPTGTLNLPGLQQQIGSFTTTRPAADPNALYIVWAGANDYLGGGITNPAEPVSNLAQAITTLAGAGARTILVPNLPSLGALPNSQNPAGLNALSEAHNTGLALTLNGLSQTLPQVDLIPLDINSLFQQAIANPSQFGFTNVTAPCLLNLTCTNPDEFLFWDTLHPTTAGHEIVANFAFDILKADEPKPPTSVPEATPILGLLVLGGLGASSAFRRKMTKDTSTF
ncbi:SGNH/GDSL hydrolase family protein [Leptolyngbya sp. FACHB-261]|nr:SGNH/GDSL hydrolase family protein [Leptolyngbya sp. FACHB-261]